MKIIFSNKQLKKKFEDEKLLRRAYGDERARKIMLRMNELYAQPKYAVHPGSYIEEILDAQNMTQKELADRTNYSRLIER